MFLSHKPLRFFIKLLSFCFFHLTFSQNYEIIERPINNNGYSKTLPKHIYINHDGFYWYSTYNGLVKDYGNEDFFIPLNHPKDKVILKVHDIFESDTGMLWVTTSNGLFTKNMNTGVEKWYFTDIKHNNNKHLEIISIFEDSKKNIWFGSKGNLIFKFKKDRLIPFTLFNESKNDSIETTIVSELEDGSLLLKQRNSWYRFYNGEVELLLELEEKKNNIKFSSFVKNGLLFKNNHSGSYIYGGKKFNYHYIASCDIQIYEIPFVIKPNQFQKKNDKNMQNYVIKNSILYTSHFYESNGKTVLNIEEKIKLRRPIGSYEILGKDLLTIGESGITFYRLKHNYFKTDLKKNNKISTRGFAQDSHGSLYLYTYKGFFKKESHETTFKSFPILKNLSGYKLEDDVHNFYMENDSIFWCYGYSPDLKRININTGDFKTFTHTARSKWTSNSFILDIEPFDDNSFFIGGTHGLFEFRKDVSEFIDRNKLSDDIDLKDIEVRDIYYNTYKRELWIGTHKNGLFVKNLRTGNVYHFHEKSSKFPICNNNIEYIHKGKNGNMWIATFNGLQKINSTNLKSENESIYKGFMNSHITGILENDDEDAIWMSTYNGLIKYNKESKLIDEFFNQEGISNNEFNTKSFFKANDSSFYFGGIDGITHFNPKEIKNFNSKPQIFLTSVQIFNKDFEKENLIFGLNQLTEITIPSNRNFINLSFSINDVFDSEQCLYQYKLNEENYYWSNLSNNAVVSLNNLKPGEHLLTVRGFDSNGHVTNSLTYTIFINQVFYKSTWFIGFLIVAFFTLILFLQAKRKVATLNRVMIENKMKQLEVRSLQASMNPHFIFNSLNGVQNAMITKGELAANKYITGFSKLLRLTLDINRREYITLKEEIQYLEAYLKLEKFRLNNMLEVTVEVSTNVNIDKIKVPSMLLQPIVENSIVHGLLPKKKDRKLRITFNKEDNFLIIQIIDNGIGREAAELKKAASGTYHKSWASKILNDRINILNSINEKKIQYRIIDIKQNKKPVGTKVYFEIPIVNDAI